MAVVLWFELVTTGGEEAGAGPLLDSVHQRPVYTRVARHPELPPVIPLTSVVSLQHFVHDCAAGGGETPCRQPGGAIEHQIGPNPRFVRLQRHSGR